MLRAFVLLLLAVPLQAVADGIWCAVTDNNHIIALSSINYLTSAPGSSKFNIVLNDSTAVTDVEAITFSQFHSGGNPAIDSDKTTELRFEGDIILICNAKLGASLSILALDGRTLLTTTIVSDNQEVDISGLIPGVYILNVDNKPMKFRKL